MPQTCSVCLGTQGWHTVSYCVKDGNNRKGDSSFSLLCLLGALAATADEPFCFDDSTL